MESPMDTSERQYVSDFSFWDITNEPFAFFIHISTQLKRMCEKSLRVLAEHYCTSRRSRMFYQRLIESLRWPSRIYIFVVDRMLMDVWELLTLEHIMWCVIGWCEGWSRWRARVWWLGNEKIFPRSPTIAILLDSDSQTHIFSQMIHDFWERKLKWSRHKQSNWIDANFTISA